MLPSYEVLSMVKPTDVNELLFKTTESLITTA